MQVSKTRPTQLFPQMTLEGGREGSHLQEHVSLSTLFPSSPSPEVCCQPLPSQDGRFEQPRAPVLHAPEATVSWPGQPAFPGPLETGMVWVPIPHTTSFRKASLVVYLVLGRNPSGACPWEQEHRREAGLGHHPQDTKSRQPPAGPPSLPAPHVSTYRQVAGLCSPPLRAAEDHISQGRGVVLGQCALGTEGMEPWRLRTGPAGVQGAPKPCTVGPQGQTVPLHTAFVSRACDVGGRGNRCFVCSCSLRPKGRWLHPLICTLFTIRGEYEIDTNASISTKASQRPPALSASGSV